ncbi:MAG: hypothetical protein COX62_02260 [Deltaproteobacteria bacterium CG_4_10_14_0_2_um_filter_43_8]|nr:MAG: hypothetical protein COV43_01840 [Deltaproteobacteria bacterium CG11_big_fil_rev_8_21_14_0_20_42_23]PJA21542.1 MAG: hypothetical protein COX62_02260 [Deltaproteobacteria bacterium CG_4_10_14_0_2_um_filter_43_8]PJC63976.1 MAG: hypothetical protein CO021_06605 [Deltaproteobacteria bacterium CG_4_9_14_0_2_um_filter_42_21]
MFHKLRESITSVLSGQFPPLLLAGICKKTLQPRNAVPIGTASRRFDQKTVDISALFRIDAPLNLKEIPWLE